jgi:hypothetical protein
MEPITINPLIYRVLIVLYVWCCAPLNSYGQLITDPTGAEQWMLGGSSAGLANVFAANNNCAAISQLNKYQVGLYSEQRFTESHLQTTNLCVTFPTKYVYFGASINHFGYSAFNQQRLSISVVKRLSSTFSLGVQLNYISTFIQDYGTTGNPVLGLGMYAKPLPKLTLGFVVFNPTQSTFGKNTTEKVPTYARLGVGYTLSKKVKMILEADQHLNAATIWRFGLNYQIHEVLSLSMGAATNPSCYTFGSGILLKKVKVDIAVSIHEVLGFTPHLGVSFPIVK